MRGSRNFCQFHLVLSLFQSLKRVPMALLLRKLYLYFTKDPEAIHYFPGGGGGGVRVSNFFPGGGVQMLLFYRNIYVLVIFQGECPDPISPSGSTRGQCRNNGTIFITVRPLTIIVRP